MEQSPINLEDLNFEFHDVSSDLQFKNFDVLPLAITLSNTHDSGRTEHTFIFRVQRYLGAIN